MEGIEKGEGRRDVPAKKEGKGLQVVPWFVIYIHYLFLGYNIGTEKHANT